MRQIVRDNFIRFSEPLEGIVPHMYQDSKGLVTVGMGNLIEPIQLGWPLPWRRKDGTLAGTTEYVAEWNTINGKDSLAKDGWTAATPLCSLHLSPEDIRSLVYLKMDQNEILIKRRVPNFDSLCADAQLMLHSWAWAVGPNAEYPRMLRYINRGDFMGAIGECEINPKVGTVILRNDANKRLLVNAASGQEPNRLLFFEATDPITDHSVRSLQMALATLGFKVKVDGVMGPQTTGTLKGFQLTHKLKVDGIAGPLTWNAIHTALRFR